MSGINDSRVFLFQHFSILALLIEIFKIYPKLPVWGLSGVHLVNSDDELLDTQSVGEKGVFSGLSVLGDSSFEFSNTGSDNQNGAIGLRGSSNHVLDEISVAWGVDDGNVELKIS